jgi:diaminopimelate epimerase
MLLLEAGGRYRVFNADGGESGQCGNGARCIAAWLADGDPLDLELKSAAGPVQARVGRNGIVSINLGVPDFRPEAVPFKAGAAAAVTAAATPGATAAAAPGPAAEPTPAYRLDLPSGPVEFGVVSMGNPHAVLFVDSVESAAVSTIGPALQAHPSFPESVNVGFAEVAARDRIRLRVYERGVGETLACGTGAAAAVATGRVRGLLDQRVAVELPGGVLEVEWRGNGAELWQTGQTSKVYEGLIEI